MHLEAGQPVLCHFIEEWLKHLGMDYSCDFLVECRMLDRYTTRDRDGFNYFVARVPHKFLEQMKTYDAAHRLDTHEPSTHPVPIDED